MSPLHDACRDGDTERVRQLLDEKGAAIDAPPLGVPLASVGAGRDSPRSAACRVKTPVLCCRAVNRGAASACGAEETERLADFRPVQPGSPRVHMQLVLAALLLALDVAASWLPTAPALRPRHDTRTHRAASATRRAASITAAAGGGARLVYCDGLSKSYDGQRFQFRDISLGVATGQRVGLIGVNGVGKSTLMKCLAGIEQHDAGRSALSLCLCPCLRLSLRLSSRPHAVASAQAFASASASASASTSASASASASAPASASASASASAVSFALTFAPLTACSVGFEGRPHVLYVEQEPARGQDLEGGAEWTVADALTEPMAAGESASTPGATETAAALRAVRPPWSWR